MVGGSAIEVGHTMRLTGYNNKTIKSAVWQYCIISNGNTSGTYRLTQSEVWERVVEKRCYRMNRTTQQFLIFS